MEDKRTEQYRQELKEFVMSHTEDVLKNPRSFIRYPFIDPGSVYDGNVWDWDTYWSVYGFLNLADSYQDPSVKPRIIEHAQGNIRNFFDHQLEDGYIPMMIEVADWPEPYLNMRHKEGKIMNMHKPFLCSQMCLISDYTGDYAWTEEFLSGVAKYFECYDHYYFHENSGLYVWQDDIMIGMDNDPATFGRPSFSTANIYLNRTDEFGRQEYIDDIRDMVRTLYNHPSIVTWVPFNEGWGQFSTKKITDFIHRLDPSRLVDSASGWFDQGCGDINSLHYYFLGLPVPESDRVLALSEFGGYSLRLPEHSACRNIYGYKKFTTSEALTDGFSRLMENTIVPSVKKGYSATVFTQLSDIEEETNGLITYDRKKIKMNPLIVQKWNTKLKKSLHN